MTERRMKLFRSSSLAAVFLALLVLLGGGLPPVADCGETAGKAKYVFLFIGDGMGIPQRNAAELYLASLKGGSEPSVVKLAMSEFPVLGMTTTYSIDTVITDSAAAGTAMACGVKTTNAGIGVDGRNTPVRTVAELARDAGKKVGIVTTVSLDHATPAAFYAHQPSRRDYYEIALQLPRSGFNYFAGGGFLDPDGVKVKKEGSKPGILDQIRLAGYRYLNRKDDFAALKKGDDKVVFVDPTLQDEQSMPYSLDAGHGELSLADLTAKGIELLDNPEGFFMMVEAGKIDWACHANDAMSAIADTVALDRAVMEAVRFLAKHPAETLIVVTGDHETGGMTIGFAGTRYESYHDRLQAQKLSFVAFTERMRAYRKDHAPGSGTDGKFEDVIPLMEECFGLRVVSEAQAATMARGEAAGPYGKGKDIYGLVLKAHEFESLKAAFARSMAGEKERSGNEVEYLLYGSYDPFTVTLTHILDHKAGLAWTSFSHTGVPVITSAIGVGSDAFGGYYDNTDIFKKMVSAMGLTAVAR